MAINIVLPITIEEPLRSILRQILEGINHHQVNIVTTVPTTATLKEGERVLYYDATNLFVYTNRAGDLHRIQWTAV
jgi:hypothetical protein